MRILRFLGLGAVVLAIVVGAMAVGARFSDGPVAVFPGGSFRSGDWVDEPVTDWSFATDVDTVEMQLEGGETSRTVWILVSDREAFVPCSLGFPPGKNWHRTAVKDGRAVLRHDGRRYPVDLAKIEDEAVTTALAGVVEDKYGASPPSGETWFFRVASRAR